MNASKENARKARAALTNIDAELGGGGCEGDFNVLRKFLDAAERKLPTEAAFTRDKIRRNKR
jgi:hypothetical protein